MEYTDFELELRPLGGGQYDAKVHSSPVGQANNTFRQPFQAMELENFLLKLGARGGLRKMAAAEADFAKEFGGRLFDAAFSGQVLLCWRQSMRSLVKGRGLRVRLRMSEAPEFQEYPWEYLYDGENFLAPRKDVAVVRTLDVSDTFIPATLRGPLRILVVIAKPSILPSLDVEKEWGVIADSLKAVVAGGSVELKRLPGATQGELLKELDRQDYHVLHFIGHGEIDSRSGTAYLAFEDGAGGLVRVSAADLAQLTVDQPSLRVAVLNSCEGASPAGDSPFSGIAQKLVRSGIPAVVAMQSAISDRAAILFSAAFYEALANGSSIDEAMARARRSMFADSDSVGLEWGTPVLYLRGASGEVFRFLRRDHHSEDAVWVKRLEHPVEEIHEVQKDLVLRTRSVVAVKLLDSEDLVIHRPQRDFSVVFGIAPHSAAARVFVVSGDDPVCPLAFEMTSLDYRRSEHTSLRTQLPSAPLALSCWPDEASLLALFANGYARFLLGAGVPPSLVTWRHRVVAAAFSEHVFVTAAANEEQLRIYATDFQETVYPLRRVSEMYLMALSRYGSALCLADHNHVLTVLDVEKKEIKKELHQNHWITAIALNDDGTILAFAISDPPRTIFICDLTSRNTAARSFGTSGSLVMCLTFSSRKPMLYSGDAGGEIRAWTLDLGN